MVDPLVVTIIKMVGWFYCSVVVKLIILMSSKLLSACCDQDLQIRRLLGECLGELGAIDPRRSLNAYLINS